MSDDDPQGSALARLATSVAAADGPEDVVAAAGEAGASLLGTESVSVAVYTRQSTGLVLVASTDEAAPSVGGDHPYFRALDADELVWTADAVAVPVPESGVVVLEAAVPERGGDEDGDGSEDGDETEDEIPERALRTLAATTYGGATARRQVTRLSEAIKELERENDQLRNFAEIAAHDLRNPLTVAKARLEFAAETGEAEHFEKLAESLDRIESIINHTLTMAQEGIEHVETERADLADLAESAWENVDTGDAALDVEGSTAVEADPERALQLFENLFRNAVEHGGPGVSVRVGRTAAESGDRGDGDSSDAADDGSDEPDVEAAGFYVADDGPGIPPGERDAVFDRGHSGREAGTGLGLAIVEEVADEHGWDVSVGESESGGARFEVTGV